MICCQKFKKFYIKLNNYLNILKRRTGWQHSITARSTHSVANTQF